MMSMKPVCCRCCTLSLGNVVLGRRRPSSAVGSWQRLPVRWGPPWGLYLEVPQTVPREAQGSQRWRPSLSCSQVHRTPKRVAFIIRRPVCNCWRVRLNRRWAHSFLLLRSTTLLLGARVVAQRAGQALLRSGPALGNSKTRALTTCTWGTLILTRAIWGIIMEWGVVFRDIFVRFEHCASPWCSFALLPLPKVEENAMLITPQLIPLTLRRLRRAGSIPMGTPARES